MVGTRRRGTQVAQRWTVLLGVWLGLAVFAAAQIWISRAALGDPPPVWPLVRLEFPIWMFWVAATVAIVRLSRVRPLDRDRVGASVAVHLACAMVCAATFVGFRLLWYQAFNPYPWLDLPSSRWFWRMFRESFIDGFVLYWAIVGVHHAFSNWARLRERELEAVAMRGRLAEATLQTLRSQLRPHFLFNALNTVSAVLEENPRRARRVLGRLADLLRGSLRTDGPQEVPLSHEMDLVSAYLEVEQERFGKRLAVAVEMAPDVADAAVPSFLLQPLVENAVRHGIAPREGPGRVAVRASRLNGTLELEVEDDGLGLPAGPIKEGVGLGNTRRRLKELYGRDDCLLIQSGPTAGLVVMIRLPYRPIAYGDREAW